MNMITNVVCLAVGAAIGFVASAKYFEKKYKDICDFEIAEYKKLKTPVEEENKEDEVVEESEPGDEYFEIASKYNGTAEEETSMIEKEYNEAEEPYQIDEIDEFGELPEYTVVTLYYYSDGVLATEDNDPIDNPDDIVGLSNLNLLDGGDIDSIYVRNDRLKCDYEVLLCEKPYGVI